MATPPGYAQVSMQLSLQGFPRQAYCTFGVHSGSMSAGPVAAEVAAAFGATGSLFTVFGSKVTLSGVRTSVGTDGAEDLIGFTVTNVACTKAGSTHTPNVAILVHKRTTRGGRRGRGRMFFPWCLTEVDSDEAGILTPASITVLQNACNKFMSELTTRVGGMVLLHQPSGPEVEPPTNPGAPTDVILLEVDPLVSTQRRRLGRR